MSFANPSLLALLAVAPLVALAYLELARWRRRAGERFFGGEDGAGSSASAGRRAIKAALVVLAVAAVVIALARPRLGEDERVVRRFGADVVIALDVSRSMLAADVEPSRLAAAQEETLLLLDGLQGHRVGLVIFGRSALLRSPLTSDSAPLRALVQSALQDSALVEPGSGVGAALRASAQALEGGEAKSQAIILISDGEDHEGGALAAAEEAAQQGIAIYAVVVGTEEGAPVPAVDPETGLPLEAALAGAPFTRSNDILLRRIADAASEGKFATVDGLPRLAGAVERLEPTPFAAERQSRPIERFQWAVLTALALLALEALVPERRGARLPRLRLPGLASAPARPLAVLLALGLVAGAACGANAAGLIDDGNRAFDRGEYAAALEFYREAEAAAPDAPEARINAGLALYRLERFKEAALETARALPIDDPELAARAHYNLGSHYLRLGRPREAFDSYRQALLLDPDGEDAKNNIEIASRLIAAMLTEEVAGEGTGDSGEAGEPDGPDEGQAPRDGDDAPGGGSEGGAAAEAALAEALAAFEGELTMDEALRLLDLARDLNRSRPVGGPEGSEEGHPDY